MLIAANDSYPAVPNQKKKQNLCEHYKMKDHALMKSAFAVASDSFT